VRAKPGQFKSSYAGDQEPESHHKKKEEEGKTGKLKGEAGDIISFFSSAYWELKSYGNRGNEGGKQD